MKKQLGLFDLVMICISFVIGMGIFRAPANVAAATPTPFLFYLCWIAGGLVSLCGALTYAEIGSRLPITGGYYKIFSYAYHPSVAFGINCIILVSNAASMAAVALLGSEYLISLIAPMSKDTAYMSIPSNAAHIQSIEIGIALISIFIFYIVNILGLKLSSGTQNVLMIIKIGLVILLITPVFFAPPETTSLLTGPIEKPTTPLREYIKAFGIGLVAVSFTYGGYQQTINFGEEVKNPSKNIPRGIFLGILIIVSLYLTVNYAYVRVIGFEELKRSENIAAIMASKIFGPMTEMILSVLLFFGVLAYINSSLLSNPRVMYAMGKDALFPKSFTRQNKHGALILSVSFYAAVAALIVFWAKEFDKILSFTIFLDCFGMALSAGSIFYIRRKTRQAGRSGIYEMKWYPLMPVIFIAAYAFVGISIAMDYKQNNYAALTGLGVLVFFMILYFIFYRKTKKQFL